MRTKFLKLSRQCFEKECKKTSSKHNCNLECCNLNQYMECMAKMATKDQAYSLMKQVDYHRYRRVKLWDSQHYLNYRVKNWDINKQSIVFWITRLIIYIQKIMMNLLGIQMPHPKKSVLALITGMHFYMKQIIISGL